MGNNACCRHVVKLCLVIVTGIALAAVPSSVAQDASNLQLSNLQPSFSRGLNLNGPAVTIDGRQWQGSDSPHYICKDNAFVSQDVPLVPATDESRAQMIRSSRWGGNRVELTDIAPGTYSLFLYVWEDNQSETYSIAVNGRQVLAAYQSGKAGHWEKLGPWYVTPKDGKIVLTSKGGAANFSGIELWHGKYDGIDDVISEEQLAFFEKRIRPLLIDKCYECHSAGAEDLAGELLVDSRATLRRGGSLGPAVIPGRPKDSLLIQAVRFENPDLQMPPDEKLSDQQIADLEHWVQSGAADPRSEASKHLGKQIDIQSAKQFWSLRPLVDPTVPVLDTDHWSRTDIDRLILAKLNEQGLAPARDAERSALIRRVTYDLIGLPPSPAEIDEFLQDTAADAFERVVERLLRSPRYGERWGRHWLDVVRYADTAGDNSDYPIPQMHRYRDWVIDAFNRDLPYDEFVRDQLAGDLRGAANETQRFERTVATGYIANSRRFGSRVDDYPQHLTIEDSIDNLGRTFLGMTLSCARCHDHKFDPITTRDYYGLYGIFQSTRYPWPGIELDKRQRDFVALVPRNQLADIERSVAEHQQSQKRLDEELQKLKDALKETPEAEQARAKEAIAKAEQVAKQHAKSAPLYATAYAVADAESPDDSNVHLKGDPNRMGDRVPRHFPAVLGGGELASDAEFSGRLQLADWILSDDNPLTSRVMVNRIWQHHFGKGIVPTANDFGKQGKPPTHPELLDHLALQFRESGWSIKAMHRLILFSRVYQQSSQRDPQAIEQDPNNDHLAGFPRLRLDAESIRDSLLSIGQNLNVDAVGEHPFPHPSTWDFTQHKPFKAVYESDHRSVYLMTQRIQRHPFLAIFDGADPSTSTAARMNTTTPLQALYLMNDPFLHAQSERIAARVIAAGSDPVTRIDLGYRLLIQRPPSAEELSQSTQFLERMGQLLTDSDPVDETQIWSAWVRAMLRLNEFVYLD